MTAINQPRDSLPSRFNASAVSFVAAIGGFLFGYDLGLIAVTNIYLKEQFHLSTEEFGWVTATTGWGCMLGPILGAWLCNALGRKTTMIIAAMLLAVGAVLTAVPDVAAGMSDEATMLVFKVFRGGWTGRGSVFRGFAFVHRRGGSGGRRGGLGLMYQLAIVLGHVMAPAFGYLVVISLPHYDGVAPLVWQQPWRGGCSPRRRSPCWCS